MKNPIKEEKPTKGFDRVERGGSWYNGVRRTRVSYRAYNPIDRFYDLGFRIVRNK
jgi:formylglycine-generating enzyme required for sulfatase activity